MGFLGENSTDGDGAPPSSQGCVAADGISIKTQGSHTVPSGPWDDGYTLKMTEITPSHIKQDKTVLECEPQLAEI